MMLFGCCCRAFGVPTQGAAVQISVPVHPRVLHPAERLLKGMPPHPRQPGSLSWSRLFSQNARLRWGKLKSSGACIQGLSAMQSVAVAPFIINYSGCIFREYPGPWQVGLCHLCIHVLNVWILDLQHPEHGGLLCVSPIRSLRVCQLSGMIKAAQGCAGETREGASCGEGPCCR